MQEMRAEYKLLIGIGIIFTFILLFFLIKENYFKDLSSKYKESKLISCTEQKGQKRINYTNHTCTIKDETGRSYTISYPEIEEKTEEISKINMYLKKKFEEAKSSVVYHDKNGKLNFSSYDMINFKFYNSNNILSILIEYRAVSGKYLTPTYNYETYNIDLTNNEIIENESIKKLLEIDRNYSSSLKGIIVKMYLEKFRYDYNNANEKIRNRFIDTSVESITYNNINNIYLDDDGLIHYMMKLYNPQKQRIVMYRFTIDKNKNTTYEMIDS